jgi:hypothetical protein
LCKKSFYRRNLLTGHVKREHQDEEDLENYLKEIKNSKIPRNEKQKYYNKD